MTGRIILITGFNRGVGNATGLALYFFSGNLI